MAVCRTCGSQSSKGVRFCQVCGAVVQETAKANPPGKNPGTAVLVAALVGLLFMGAGHFYVQRFVRGIAILIAGIATGIVFFVAVFGGFFAASFLIALSFGLIRIGLWLWQIRDAHKLAKHYNEVIENTGEPPW